MHRIDIEQNTKVKYSQQFDGITFTNISLQTTFYDAQTSKYKCRYNPGAVEELSLDSD